MPSPRFMTSACDRSRRVLARSARSCVALACVVPLGGCSTSPTASLPEPEGPGRIRLDVVERHAEQFDIELPERPPGSQEEEIAATYILGHLQRAGYQVLLDPVPVAATVRSTNVVALPPSGEPAEFVVTVSYDTSENLNAQAIERHEWFGGFPAGTSIGLFLELARALNVRRPDHSVAFVTIGADHLRRGGGLLGTRRLAEFLDRRGEAPTVVVLGEVGDRFGLAHAGDWDPQIDPAIASPPSHGEMPSLDAHARRGAIFREDGFRVLFIAGSTREVGDTLLNLLKGSES